MTKLIFITHPAVDADPDLPASQWKISSVGKEEASRLLEQEFWNDVSIIFTSPEPKASEVANQAAKEFNLDIKEVNELREIDRSVTGFLPTEQYMKAVEEFYIHPTDSYKGWETANDATLRIKTAIESALNNYEDGTVVVFGHGMIGTCLACWVKGIDPSFNEDPKVSGCYMIMDWSNRKILTDWEKY